MSTYKPVSLPQNCPLSAFSHSMQEKYRTPTPAKDFLKHAINKCQLTGGFDDFFNNSDPAKEKFFNTMYKKVQNNEEI